MSARRPIILKWPETQRYAPVPWCDVPQSDLQPYGQPETIVEKKGSARLSLHVVGEYVPTLGMVALSCKVGWRGEWEPVGCALAETVMVDAARDWSYATVSKEIAKARLRFEQDEWGRGEM